jgi:hypothetical protein
MNLGPPNTFPGEINYLFASKDLTERSNIKVPFVRRRPPKLVFPFTSHFNGIQQGAKESQEIHLPVVSRSNKANIPLKGTTFQNQVSCNEHILITSYAIQNQESFLEGHPSTPHIIPKFDPVPISQNKSGMITKQTQPLPYVLPKPHSVRLRGI